MTQKIKAVKVSSQPTRTGGTLFAVRDARNTRYSGFLDELKTVRAGDTIEAEIQVDGNFNNITTLRGNARICARRGMTFALWRRKRREWHLHKG